MIHGLIQRLSIERLIHSIKTAIACLIGLTLVKLSYFHVDQWLLITIIVVMCAQINVGSLLYKSWVRFLGTATGSLIACFSILIFGTSFATIAIIIALSSIFFSYIATSKANFSDSGTLGAVTVIIILLAPHPSIIIALQRFSEISAGILIATLISQFVLPIRARDHLREMQAKTLSQLRDYYEMCFISLKDANSIQELDENIIKSLSSQRDLAKQAAREPFGETYDNALFNKILHCEKEILRSIVCMHYANDMIPNGKQIFADMSYIQQFHQYVIHALHTIGNNMNQSADNKVKITIPSLQPIKDAINQMRMHMAVDDLVYIDGFLFCAEIVVIHVTELTILEKNSNKKL